MRRRAVLAGMAAPFLAGMAAPCLAGLAAPFLARPAAAAPVPLTIGAQAGGTLAWELQVIAERGLDAAQGLALRRRDLAGSAATQIALQGGAVDAIVTDWFWAAEARAGGLDIVAIPFSTATGGMMVSADSPIGGLADLRGRRIAVAGGPIDKGWLILRALGLTQGIDLAAETDAVFAAPPLVMQAALSGEVDAAVNFWQFLARMRAQGMRDLITLRSALATLGLDPSAPLLVYALRRDRLAAGAIAALGRTSSAAKALMARDDAVWTRLRPQMGAAGEAEFTALRDGFRAGIPPSQAVDPAAAERLLRLLQPLDPTLGASTGVPPGLFDPDG